MTVQLNHPILITIIFAVIGDYAICFKPYEHRILTYSLTAFEGKNKYANDTIFYASDFFYTIAKRHVLFYNGYKQSRMPLSIIYSNNNPKSLKSSSYTCKGNNWICITRNLPS